MKPRRKKRKNDYFTKDHENAIVKYCASASRKEREDLYIGLIGPAFNEMVDKIIYTYKFNTLPNIKELSEECKIWLTTILNKYNPNRGSKAFSYFSVVTKNWFIHKVKVNSKKIRKEVSFEDLVQNGGPDILGTSSSVEKGENIYLDKREEAEFWSSLLNQMEVWSEAPLKPPERTVLSAVNILLNNVEDIEIFNKKAIYLYLRELTGMNTKQVVNNLNKIRDKYRIFKLKWDRSE